MPPCEVWFHRDGQVIGAGRTTRTINRRLRRALEYRHPTCAVPGCGATRGLHAHHIRHWEDGGATELHNLVLLCPYHHRLHHRGAITITGPPDNLTVTDSRRPHTELGIACATTESTPTRRGPLPRTPRRTRPLEVVRPLRTTTTTDQQLGAAGIQHYIEAQTGRISRRFAMPSNTSATADGRDRNGE